MPDDELAQQIALHDTAAQQLERTAAEHTQTARHLRQKARMERFQADDMRKKGRSAYERFQAGVVDARLARVVLYQPEQLAREIGAMLAEPEAATGATAQERLASFMADMVIGWQLEGQEIRNQGEQATQRSSAEQEQGAPT